MSSEPERPHNDKISRSSDSTDEPDSSGLPPEGEDISSGLSPQQRQDLTRFIDSGVEMSVISGNPLASRINERHLSDMIDLAGKELDYDYNDRQRNRIFWGMLIAFAVFLALQDMSSLLSQLLRDGLLFLSGLAAGLGCGYGLARRKR